MSSGDILFAYNTSTDPGTLLPDRQMVFGLLQDRDLRPVVSVGIKAGEEAFHDGQVDVGELVGPDEVYSGLGTLALHEEIKVVVNRVDRTIKVSDLPPTINGGPTRSLGHWKMRAHEQVLVPAGIAIPTVRPATLDEVEAFAAEQDCGEYFMKPEIGRFGAGRSRVPAAEVLDAFAGLPENKVGKMLLQPALDLTHPFPDSIKPFDDASREAFDACSRPGLTRELGMYCFYSNDTLALFPVGRVVAEEDAWFFVDPDTVPEGLYDNTRDAMELVAQATDEPAFYGRLDYGYGTYGEFKDPSWSAIELNLRSPYMIGSDRHPDVARRLRVLLADQILDATMIERPGAAERAAEADNL